MSSLTSIVLLVSTFLASTITEIVLASTYLPKGGKAVAYSWTGAGSHFADILQEKGKFTVQIVTITNATKYTQKLNGYAIKFNNGSAFKTIADRTAFLVFNKTYLAKESNNFASATVLINNNLIEILDSVFFNSNSQILLIYKNGSNFTLKYLNGTLPLTDTQLPIRSNSSFKKSQVSPTAIYLLFDVGLLIYEPSPTTLNLKYSHIYPSPAAFTSLSLYSNILCYSYNSELLVKDTNSNFSLLRSFNHTEPIRDLAIAKTPYLMLATVNTIQQLDIDIGVVIHSLSVDMSNKSFGVLLERYFALYMERPASSSSIQIYEMKDYYNCSGTACIDGYYYNSSCFKNYSVSLTNATQPVLNSSALNFTVFFPQNTTNLSSLNETNQTNLTFFNTTNVSILNESNPTNQTVYPNSSLNFSNSSNLSSGLANYSNQTNVSISITLLISVNVSVNSTFGNLSDNNTFTNLSVNNSFSNVLPNNSYVNQVIKQDFPSPSCEQSIQEKKMEFLTPMSKAVGKTLIITSIKMTPSCFTSFLLLLDDFQYYEYHRNQYPTSFKLFTGKIDLINAERLNPQLFQFISVLNKQAIANSEDQKALKSFSFHKNNPQSVYFLHSTETIYKTGLFLNLLLMLIARILVILLRFLAKKCPAFEKLYSYCEASTRWWSIILAIVETNLIKLSFYCTLQVLITGFDSPFDKLNTVAMVFSWMVALFYALSFYPIIYKYSDKKAASTILVRSSYSRNSFLLETFCVLLRNFTRGFCHAIFLQNYSWQIVSLTVTDAVFILFTLAFRKNFISKYVFLFFLMYQLILLSLDFLFMSFNRHYLEPNETLYDLVVFILIICILFNSMFLSLAILVQTIYEFLVQNFKFFQKQSNSQKQIKDTKEASCQKNNLQIYIPVQIDLQMKNQITQQLALQKQITTYSKKKNSHQKKMFPPNEYFISFQNLLPKRNKFVVKVQKTQSEGNFMHVLTIKPILSKKNILGKRRKESKIYGRNENRLGKHKTMIQITQIQ